MDEKTEFKSRQRGKRIFLGLLAVSMFVQLYFLAKFGWLAG